MLKLIDKKTLAFYTQYFLLSDTQQVFRYSDYYAPTIFYWGVGHVASPLSEGPVHFFSYTIAGASVSHCFVNTTVFLQESKA